MPSTPYAGRTRFGLLPEPESNPASVLTSFILNGAVLALILVFGTVAHHEIELRKMETTDITFPTTPPPEIKIKVKVPPAPKVQPKIELPKVAKLEAPKIMTPRIEPKPEMKPLPVIKEAVPLPQVTAAKPQIVLAPQPKAALAAAAAPALTPQAHPSTAPIALGQLTGVPTNSSAVKTANIGSVGNPYGGPNGPAAVPHGVFGSMGSGNGAKSGSNAGGMGKVASAGIPGGNGSATGGGFGGGNGKVASAIAPSIASTTSPAGAPAVQETKTTPPVLISSTKPSYTSEATQLKIQGDVVLRVTITTNGGVVVHGVIHGLGHGLDESAMRTAPTYKFQPATRNGQPVEFTTNIIIKFQTA